MVMPDQAATDTLSIFIAYRRDDVPFAVDRLDSDLRRAFGRDSVFRDVRDIGLEQWKQRIEEELNQASVVIVAIGPNWLGAKDDGGELRLWQPDDRLRIEIEQALSLGVLIVPVQLLGAAMPTDRDLPPALASLADWQSESIDDRRWDEEVGRLIEKLSSLTGPGPSAFDRPSTDPARLSADPARPASDQATADPEPPLPTFWIAMGVLIIIVMIVIVVIFS